MSIKYRVQWYADDCAPMTEYKTKSYLDGMTTATSMASQSCAVQHRVQSKVKGGKWQTIAELEPAAELREMQ